ncbi:MAG: ABC transporter ATP-binding protein [Clostridia bacterium]|nr:ABC transporter ATP-binding protein [Clostridia bacterium]MCL6521162.1 ABC transporter ATP-binding protein [Bacillota bacterium]
MLPSSLRAPGGGAPARPAASAGALAVRCQGVVKRFREPEEPDGPAGRLGLLGRLGRRRRAVEALSGVDLAVPTGSIYGVLGANGSGKSTLIRLLATLLLPDEGRLEVFGHDVVREPAAVRRRINRVSVEASFFKTLSAWENLLYAARLYGLAPGEARERSAAVLERLGLPAQKLHARVETLSRGQQQKVAVARALLTAPDLLLLDEPTTGLDPRSKREVQDFLREVHEEAGTTILLTTHDMDEVERLCGRVAILDGGRVVAEGTVAELKLRFAGSESADMEEVFLRCTS